WAERGNSRAWDARVQKGSPNVQHYSASDEDGFPGPCIPVFPEWQSEMIAQSCSFIHFPEQAAFPQERDDTFHKAFEEARQIGDQHESVCRPRPVPLFEPA